MSEGIKKDWERPWTTEEIVEHADNWNLACDAALLNTLKSFGDKLLRKADEVNDKIENLSKNLSKIDLQVDLVRNEFSSLRNTQFVECRVYEDDETIIPEKPKEKQENEAQEETIEDFREVVAVGLEILDDFYDKVDVTVSDSEGEDEEGPSYIFRRKDPYINRRLPLVIGSEEWHKKWHVGLEDTDSENEHSSEKLSDSESEEYSSQNKDHSDVSSEFSNLSGLTGSKIKPVVVSTANATQQDFLASASGSDTESTPRTLSFAEQLAAKLGNVIKETEKPIEEPEVNRRPIQKKQSDFGALFSNEPPPFDDMKEKETHGIFSGGKGLFDDEDEDDLWNPGKPVTSSTKQFSTGEKKTQEYDKLDQGKGLFDNDSDEDLFAPKNYGVNQQNKKPYLQSNKPAVPVFDEEPPLFDEDSNSKEKKKPAGGVSLFGKTDIFDGQSIGKILKQRKISSSEDSNEDEPVIASKPKTKSSISNAISPIETVTKENTQNKNSTKQISIEPQKEKKKSGLFDDDIFGDDLFSSTAEEGASGLFGKSILFSDEDNNEPFLSRKSSANENTSKINIKTESSKDFQSNDLLSPETPDTEYSFRKNSKSNIGNLFDDTKNDNDDLFMPKNVKKTPKKEEIKEKIPSETTSTKQKQNLFEDDLDDVNDLFSVISKKKDDTKTKEPLGFLFDNDDDDDFNIFTTKSDIKNSEKVVKTEKISTKKEELGEPTNKSTKPKKSLFDDDLDDLFAEISKKGSSNPKSGLFDDSILNSNKKGDNEKKVEVKQPTKDKVQKELKEPIIEKESIAASKSIIEIESTEKPVKDIKENISTEQKINIQQVSTEKLTNSNVKESSETTVRKENVLPSKDRIEKAVINPSNDTAINSTEKSKTVEETVHSSNDNIPIEDARHKDSTATHTLDQMNPEDHLYTSQNIPIIQQPEINKDNVDIFANPPEDINAVKNETEKYKSSPNVLNFMDSIPPPDDDWDTYSDNTFDDMEPSNDGFKSQPSSLFDSEPPSLFFDDSNNISKGTTDDRLFSDPMVYGNKPPDVLSADLFVGNERQEEKLKANLNFTDNLEITSDKIITEEVVNEKLSKNAEENSNHPLEETRIKPEVNKNSNQKNEKPKVVDKPKVSRNKPPEKDKREQDKINKKPPIPEEKPNTDKTKSLSFWDSPPPIDFIDDQKLFEDQTDFLSTCENQTTYNDDIKISKNIISDKIIEKSVSFDNVKENRIGTDEPGGTDSDDNMQSNISKITEKLQKISSKNEERMTKPLVIPRKLSHNLNINVGALLPGSALPKRERTQSPDENEHLSKSLPASRFSLNEGFVPSKPITIVRGSSEETPTTKDYKMEKSVSFDGGTNIEVLQSITKDRVRIPVRRRPSSRRARQKSLRDSISDFRLEDPIPDGDMPSESNEPISFDSAVTKQIEQTQSLKIEAEKQEVIEKDNLSSEFSDEVVKKINVLQDEPEDIFKTIEKDILNVNTASVISTRNKDLFDDGNEELFGESTSKNTKQIDDLFQNDTDDLFGNLGYESERKNEFKETKKRETLITEKNIAKTNEKLVENDFLPTEDFEKKSKPNQTAKKSIDNLFDSSDEDDIFKSAKPSIKETKSEKEPKDKKNTPISIIGKIASETVKNNSKLESVKSKPDSLFDFSDDDDDFLENFTSGKKENNKKERSNTDKLKSNSLFDDMDDDDIFGTSSTENKTKQDVKPSVINKKPPKSTSVRKLENIEGVEDPLSALLK